MSTRRLAMFRILKDVDLPPLLSIDVPFRQILLDSLNPEITVERYGRRWRLSRPQVLEGRWLIAKLGFERLREAIRVYYDTDLEDFVVEDSRTETATFSHFVIDLETQYLLFDYRPPDIKIQSFAGALNAVLGETPLGRLLTIEPVTDTEEFFSWLSDMERIESFRVTVRRPNPSFQGRPERIRQLLEETNAARLRIEASSSESDEGLAVRQTDLETLAEYAAQGYGEISARGNDGQRGRRFSSSQNIKEDQIDIEPDEQSSSIFQKIKSRLEGLIP